MFIHNINPEIFTAGPITLRWYGLIFVIGLIAYFLIERWIFKREEYKITDLETVSLYLLLGMIIGARLGHIFFYQASYYLENPIEIFKVWQGGLSSHGAAIGVFCAYFIWTKTNKAKFNKYASVLALGMPVVAGFVRIANFFNSEIVGKPTNGKWGIVFTRLNEDFPRHPTQIYEALISFLIFFFLLLVYLKFHKKLPSLFIMFTYIFLYFLSRFIVEFWKERHILSYDSPLSMGQILSILPILISTGYFAYLIFKKAR